MKKSMLLAGLLVLAGCAALIPLKVGPPRDITVEITPERLIRGEYLANHVTHCMYCHSGANWDYYAGGHPVPGTEGGGGERIAENLGLMGGFELYTSNITPSRTFGIGEWTDGQIIQAITEGVNKDGDPLFPVMPYSPFRTMSEVDVYSVVAYLRQLKPIENQLPEKKVKRMFKIVERTFPRPWEPQPVPDPSDTVTYGKYLATIANCIFCHTTMTKSAKPIEGMDLAGGNDFALPRGGMVRSTNITPDLETGIGDRTKENFIGLFRSFQNPVKLDEDKKHENTVMPWPAFAGMTEEDLGAIYDYLRTVKPVNNRVEKYPSNELEE